jgi:arabinose-5-phosphate isomerase
MSPSSIETGRKVLQIESEAIRTLQARLGDDFDRAVELVLRCSGRVVVTGMGKSGLVARKIAATLSSTGTPALFLHPAEALHGDLGMLVPGDLVVALSSSGDTEEILNLLGPIKRLGICLLAITGGMDSALARAAEVSLDVSIDREACALGLAPTASTTAALAMGDALAVAVAERRGFSVENFAELHPGGKLGKRLAPVAQLMHKGDALPSVAPETAFADVIYEISRKGFGIATVVAPDGRLLGVVSDGDVRRLVERRGREVFDLSAEQCMTPQPVTIGAAELAPAALRVMETRKITALPVIGSDGNLVGLLHLHDLWTTQLF